eukprot:TRINITY_DN2573_c4_g1_i2.p1 TRINITY_DN2573_c4_g1~~TRINITY_DN2573_c4_g1_i2.p1  ORF type:complete len:1819 (-),score=440.74 TRINITY_DN2573_c4_g1_i2:209-5665(-)
MGFVVCNTCRGLFCGQVGLKQHLNKTNSKCKTPAAAGPAAPLRSAASALLPTQSTAGLTTGNAVGPAPPLAQPADGNAVGSAASRPRVVRDVWREVPKSVHLLMQSQIRKILKGYLLGIEAGDKAAAWKYLDEFLSYPHNALRRSSARGTRQLWKQMNESPFARMDAVDQDPKKCSDPDEEKVRLATAKAITTRPRKSSLPAMVACLLSPVLRLHEHPDEGIDNLRFGCVRLPHYSGHSQDSRPVQTIRLCAQWKGAETVSPLPRLPGVDYLSSPQLPVVPLEPGRILMGTKKAVAEESITLTDRFGASNGAAPASPVRSLATTLGGDTPAMTSQDYLPTYSNSAITPQRDVDDIARRSQEVSQQLEREMADWQAKLLRLNWRFSAENEPYSPTRPAQDSAVAPPAVGRSAPASAASTANTGREPRTPISDSRRMMPQEQFSSPPNLAASPPPIETPVPVNDTSLLQYVAKLKAAFDECATDPHEMPRYDEMEMLRKQVADQNQANHLLLLQVKDLNTKAANDQLGQLSDGGTALEVPLTPNVADRARPAFNVDREEAMLSAEFKELRPTYSVLLYTLQRSPIYLAQLLAACTADQQAEIMPTITHCLLGHYSLDESYLIEFVAQTIRDHFRQRQLQSLRSPDIVPTDSLLYRVLMAIAAREDCVLYARRTLQKIMYDLVGANALDFEVDIDRLLVAAVGSIEQLHKLVESRLPLLHGSIEGVCDSLLEEGPVQAIPDVISRTVRLLSAEAEGYSEGSGARAFTEFFWDIFLLPCLGAPESHGVIEPFTAMTPVLRRNLAIIQLIMFYFTRPITPFRSPVRASATAQVAAASQDLPDVQIDIRAGPVEDQQAVLELLNHEFKPLYQHYVRHFTEYRNRVMRPQSPRKKRRPVYDETFARETSDIIAVSVSEISLLHSVLLQQTRLHSTPPIIPPLLKQLGAPIAVHSRDEDSLILQKLRPVEESPAVLPTENANEINQIARKQLFEVKAAIADLGSLDQGYAASLLTGLERVKPYVVNWNKTRRALTRGNELLKRYNSEIAETLRIMKRSLQKAVISRMQHTADTTSLLTPFGRSASRGGFSNRLPEPMSPDTPPPQSALSNASRPTAASLLAKAAADRERKVIADADRVKMEQAQQRQQAEQLLQRQQSVSALASDRRATAQFMPVQPLHTVPSQQAAFQPPLVPQLPLGASAYQRNEQYYKHDEHPPQVPQRPEDVSPSQYQYQQQAAEPHVDEHDHAGEDQIDGDEEWVMDNPLFGAVRQGHRLPQYPPTDWYGDWQRYQEEERQLRESQQQADAGEQAHQQVPQYVPDTEQSQQSFVPSPQYAHQLLPQQSHHQQQHQFVKPPTPQPQSQAQLDPHSMQPVPRRSQATLNAANLANPTAAVDPTQWEREQWIRQQQQQPPSPQVLSSELHDMQQREAQLELRRRNSHMQQVQLQAEVEQRRQAEMAEEKRRLDEAESTFTVTNPLQAAGRRVKQLVAVPTYTAPLVPPASPVQLSTYSAVPAASPPFISLSQQQQQQQQPVYRASLQDPGAPLAVPAATAAPRFPASQTPTEVPASARYASTLSRMASVRSSERFTLPPPASSPPQRSQSQAITPDVPGSPQSQTQRAPPSPILKKPQTLASPKSRASAKLLAGLGPESAKHMPKPHELATTANYLARKQAVSGTGRASSRTSSPHSNGASTTPTQQRTHFDNAGPVHPPPARSQQDAAALAKPYTPLSQQQPIPSGQPYSGRASFSQQPMPLAQQLQQQSQAPLPFTPSPQLTPAAAPLSHMTTLPFQQAFPLQHQSPSTQSNLSALMPQRYGSPQAGYPRPY